MTTAATRSSGVTIDAARGGTGNGTANPQTWEVVRRDKRIRKPNDFPFWSMAGSAILLVGIFAFQQPTTAKYALLIAAQACYAFNIIRG